MSKKKNNINHKESYTLNGNKPTTIVAGLSMITPSSDESKFIENLNEQKRHNYTMEKLSEKNTLALNDNTNAIRSLRKTKFEIFRDWFSFIIATGAAIGMIILGVLSL